jgi:uncharacterized YccA/Bax inhibitor family protein
MRTSNPALSEKVLQRAVEGDEARAGWAAPRPVSAPAPDSISPWEPARPYDDTAVDAFSVNGAVWATAVLLVLLCAGGAVGWAATDVGVDTVELPGWIFVPFIGAIGLAIATVVRPLWARFTAPLYALAMGSAVGAISHLYEAEFDGIVFQAAVGTVGVLGVMLVLYATRVIKVTDKLRMGIVMATGAVFLVYMVNLVLRLFGTEVPFLHDTGGVGIAISLVIVGIAAFNLLLDFDFVERAAEARAPRQLEWYAAFGLLVTLVWLYLELLRLLAKLQSRD